MRMVINTSQTQIFPSQLSSRCKKCTRKRSLTCLSNKWIFVVCNMMMELLIQLQTRELSIPFYVEMVQALMLIKCSVKSIEYSLQLVYTFVSVMVYLTREWDISRNLNSSGPFSNTKLLSQQYQHQLQQLTKIKMRRTFTISMCLESKQSLRIND